jgi:hypothetical protein
MLSFMIFQQSERRPSKLQQFNNYITQLSKTRDKSICKSANTVEVKIFSSVNGCKPMYLPDSFKMYEIAHLLCGIINQYSFTPLSS